MRLRAELRRRKQLRFSVSVRVTAGDMKEGVVGSLLDDCSKSSNNASGGVSGVVVVEVVREADPEVVGSGSGSGFSEVGEDGFPPCITLLMSSLIILATPLDARGLSSGMISRNMRVNISPNCSASMADFCESSNFDNRAFKVVFSWVRSCALFLKKSF